MNTNETTRPQEGKFYTMSAMKRIGDRSYIGHVWEIISVNEHAAMIKNVDVTGWTGTEQRLVDIGEFDFTEATPQMVQAKCARITHDTEKRLVIYQRELLAAAENMVETMNAESDNTITQRLAWYTNYANAQDKLESVLKKIRINKAGE